MSVLRILGVLLLESKKMVYFTQHQQLMQASKPATSNDFSEPLNTPPIPRKKATSNKSIDISDNP